jgi:glycosyltransferase-like protein
LTAASPRIALITYSTRPRGGVVHTLALAEALVRAGAQVTVWTLGRGGDGGFFRRVDPGVRIEVVPFPPIEGEDVGARIMRSIRLLGRAFRPQDYDIVHAQDCISANAVGRCVRTVHHLDTFTTAELAACHERAIVDPFAHVCVSESVARELTDGWGLHPIVIPNGVDSPRFASAASTAPKAVAARKVWTDRLGTYLLAVGGIEPRKGTLDLLEAFALARTRHPGLQLVVAGGETLFDYRGYREQFDRRCGELGVEPVLLGTVDDDELPFLVAGAAVFGFVSTKEGFGLAAMEALAAGVPLVVRDLPVLREVFSGAALFADSPATMADQITVALSGADPGLREVGRTLANRHTWDGAAARHLEFYAALVR